MQCDVRTLLVRVSCILAVLGLCLPAAAVSGGQEQEGLLSANGTISVTNASVANATFPAQYALTPTPISLGYSTNGPLTGAPKGEMAAVPRFIGFLVSPVLLVIGLIVIAAAGAGSWFFIHRDRNTGKGK